MSTYLRTTTRRQRFEMTCAVALFAALGAGCALGVHAVTTEPAPQSIEVVTVHETSAPIVTTKVVHDTKVVHTLPECAEEDSRNCIWHADESGNGEGVTFVDIDGTAYYAETPEPVRSQEATDLAQSTHSTLGDLLVCDEGGREVSVDVLPDGTTWAACM